MKKKEKTMLEFAGFCFIQKPELTTEINTLIAGFINKPKSEKVIYGLHPLDSNLIKVKEKYGKTHKIQAVKGTNVKVHKLANNESVCWGDGENYHFLLTAL